MKKAVSLLLAAMFIVHGGLFQNVSAVGETYEEDGFTYALVYNEEYDYEFVALTKCDSSKSGEITLPEEIEFYIETEDDIFEYYEYDAIAENAFSGCNGITAINIPPSVYDISPAAFDNCPNLTKINVDNDSDVFCSLDGILYRNDGTLIRCPEGYSGKVSTACGTYAIGIGAFKNCSRITEVVLNEKLSWVDEAAFAGCTGLKTLTVNGRDTEFSENIFAENDIIAEDFCIYAPENSAAQIFAEENGYSFKALPEKTASDISVSALTAQIDGKSKVVVTVKNSSDYDIENASVIVAGYDDLSMRYITQNVVSAKSGGEGSVILPMPRGGERFNFKVYAWKSMSNIAPIEKPSQPIPALPDDISYSMGGVGTRLRGYITGVSDTGIITVEITNPFDSDQYEMYLQYEFSTSIDNTGRYLGRAVEFFVNDNTINSIDIFSPGENTVSFAFDEYDSYDSYSSRAYIYYYKDPSDRYATSCLLESGYRILLNGEEYASGIEAAAELISPEQSGRITLVDANFAIGYEIIEIDLYTSAVIQEVRNSTTISFKEVLENPVTGDGYSSLALDDIYTITEDGNTVDKTQLKEWDVLSIVLTSDGKCLEVERIIPIDSLINACQSSNIGYDGYAYRLQGNDTYYGIANECYSDAKIAVGSRGKFFIDKNNKIIAFLKHKIGSGANGGVGYILDAYVFEDEGSVPSGTVKLLDKSDKVYEMQLADSVVIENIDFLSDSTVTEELESNITGANTYYIGGIERASLEKIMTALINQAILYEIDSAGEISAIAFPQREDDEQAFYCLGMGELIYDESDEDAVIGGSRCYFDKNTAIFYVNGANEISGIGDTQNIADGNLCFVDDSNSYLCSGSYNAAIFDTDGDCNTVEIAVLFNTTGGVSPNSSLAVIESVFPITLNGTDTFMVNYFKDGELVSAAVSGNVLNIEELCYAESGDLYKFNVRNSLIKDFVKYADFERYAGGFSAGEEGGLKLLDSGFSNNDEYFYFGPVTSVSISNSRIYIAAADNSGIYDVDTSFSLRVSSDSNIYVVDPNMKNSVKVGTLNDIVYDEALIEHPYSYTTIQSREDGEVLVSAGEQALGMLDYAAIYEYDGDIKDVIIYKAYDFGKYIIQTA